MFDPTLLRTQGEPLVSFPHLIFTGYGQAGCKEAAPLQPEIQQSQKECSGPSLLLCGWLLPLPGELLNSSSKKWSKTSPARKVHSKDGNFLDQSIASLE